MVLDGLSHPRRRENWEGMRVCLGATKVISELNLINFENECARDCRMRDGRVLQICLLFWTPAVRVERFFLCNEMIQFTRGANDST